MGRLTLLFSHLSSLIFSRHDKHLRIHSSSGLCCINGGQTSAIVNIQHRKAKLCNLLCTRAIFKQWNISKPCCLYYEFRIFGWLFLFPCNDFTIGDFLPLACDLDCRRACFYLTLCVSVCVWLVPFCQHDSQLVIPFLLKSNISHEPSFSLNRKFTLKFFLKLMSPSWY